MRLDHPNLEPATDFTELEQALINTGWGYWQCEGDPTKFRWSPTWIRANANSEQHYDRVNLFAEPYTRPEPCSHRHHYKKGGKFFREHYPETGTHADYYYWHGFVVDAVTYHRIPVEDGGGLK
jgi:hypothetical protein